MIIVELMGGLGNQLFQYAMGRSISLKNKARFRIDLSFFENYEWHEYSLEPFNIKAAIATKEQCEALKKRHNSIANKVLRNTINKGHVFVKEKSILYNAAYKKITDPAYLHGYWQCERYFRDYTDVLRRDLQINIPPSPANAVILEEIGKSNAVSLHIRRGNYVTVPLFNSILGTCSLEYYARGMEHISKRVSNPVFYVFSDDISWAKENLKGNYSFVFVDINDAKHDYEDLRLMQNCKHHIIANSTFSWWGAWLNPSTDKIVIAPAKWFADPEKNKTAAYLVPGNWTKF